MEHTAVFLGGIGATGTFDYVEFVAEYAPYDFTDLPNMARAAELNDMGTMIKLDFQNRGYVAQKAVQAGFQSIMFVDHVNPDQVRESVSLIKPKTPEVSANSDIRMAAILVDSPIFR